MINYSFLKSLTAANSNMQKYFQTFLKLNLYSRKTENVQILFKSIREKICAKFLRKNCEISVLFAMFSKEL